MNVPWGKIHAQRETAEYKEKLGDLQRKVNKALELLKMDNPDTNPASQPYYKLFL